MTVNGKEVSIPVYLWAVIGTVFAALFSGGIGLLIWVVVTMHSLDIRVSLLEGTQQANATASVRVEAKIDRVAETVGALQRDFDRTFGKGP